MKKGSKPGLSNGESELLGSMELEEDMSSAERWNVCAVRIPGSS